MFFGREVEISFYIFGETGKLDAHQVSQLPPSAVPPRHTCPGSGHAPMIRYPGRYPEAEFAIRIKAAATLVRSRFCVLG